MFDAPLKIPRDYDKLLLSQLRKSKIKSSKNGKQCFSAKVDHLVLDKGIFD